MIMENLNNIDWKERERELLNLLSDKFYKLWLHYSRLGSVCIIAFPRDRAERYRIFVEYKIQDFSAENLKNIVLSKI